jgi:hypothetical protein
MSTCVVPRVLRNNTLNEKYVKIIFKKRVVFGSFYILVYSDG